jgi:hypothetical protein
MAELKAQRLKRWLWWTACAQAGRKRAGATTGSLVSRETTTADTCAGPRFMEATTQPPTETTLAGGPGCGRRPHTASRNRPSPAPRTAWRHRRGFGRARIECRGGAKESRSVAPVQGRAPSTAWPPPTPIYSPSEVALGRAGVPADFCLQHESRGPARLPGRRLSNPGRPSVTRPVSRETTATNTGAGSLLKDRRDDQRPGLP